MNVDKAKIEAKVRELQALPIISGMLRRLKQELPAHLYYHSAEHTEDVLHEVVLFATLDKLTEKEIELLALAATYHDAGYIVSQVNNEPIGALLAENAMREANSYSASEVELVRQMILDTHIQVKDGQPLQRASLPLSRYLLDADVSNFGRHDFFEKGELERREEGEERERFVEKTLVLLDSHSWQTETAQKLRDETKRENAERLKQLLARFRAYLVERQAVQLSPSQINFLLHLPLVLNSSLDTERVVKSTLQHVRDELKAGAATVFLLSENAKELVFWAMEGGDELRLAGTKMPSDRGVVGWVIKNRQAALVDDASKDPRFFALIDREGGFKTRDMICVPLLVRGEALIGALQVLNKENMGTFSKEELAFVEHVAQHVAVAIDNARLFETVKEQTHTLEVLDKRRNDMLAIVSHEFRTPLNVIQTAADMLGSGLLKDDQQRNRMFSTLMRGVERMTKIMREVCTGAQVSQSGLEVHKSVVSVMDLFEQVQARFAAVTEARKLSMTTSIGTGVQIVMADPSLITLVINNLLSNAIRYTPDGGKIEVVAKKRSGLVEISVCDSGIGIEQDEIPLIFQKFYEVRNVMEHSSGEFEFRSAGLGLGLSTVRTILEAHGTDIQVTSELGRGSKFSFTLPE